MTRSTTVTATKRAWRTSASALLALVAVILAATGGDRAGRASASRLGPRPSKLWEDDPNPITTVSGGRRRPLIFNGDVSESREYPFGAIICSDRHSNKRQVSAYSERGQTCNPLCTGSLVSPGVVLTAAHCFMEHNKVYEYDNDFTGREDYERELLKSYRVVFDKDQSGPHAIADTIGIKKIVVGEPFVFARSSAIWDLALVFLDECNHQVDPIRMLASGSPATNNTHALGSSVTAVSAMGCFDVTRHRCDCGDFVTREACEAKGGLFTDECDCPPTLRTNGLQDDDREEEEGHKLPAQVSILGWGDSEGFCVTPHGGKDAYDPLQIMSYNVKSCVTDKVCLRHPNRCDKDLMMCMTQKDTASCTGDSGGPIFYEFPSKDQPAQRRFRSNEGNESEEEVAHWLDVVALPEDPLDQEGAGSMAAMDLVSSHGSSSVLDNLKGSDPGDLLLLSDASNRFADPPREVKMDRYAHWSGEVLRPQTQQEEPQDSPTFSEMMFGFTDFSRPPLPLESQAAEAVKVAEAEEAEAAKSDEEEDALDALPPGLAAYLDQVLTSSSKGPASENVTTGEDEGRGDGRNESGLATVEELWAREFAKLREESVFLLPPQSSPAPSPSARRPPRFVQIGILSGGEILSSKYSGHEKNQFKRNMETTGFVDHATGALLPAYTEWLKHWLLLDTCLAESDLTVDDLFMTYGEVEAHLSGLRD